MASVFSCSCGKRLKVPDGHAAKKVRCPGCGEIRSVPDSAAPPEVLQAVLVPAPPPEPEVEEVLLVDPVHDQPRKRRRRRADDVHVVELTPVKGKDRDRPWSLELGDEEVRLIDHRGDLVTTLQRSEANPRISFPSFWLSVKHLQIHAEDGAIYDFVPEKRAMNEIRSYLDVALLEDAAARGTLKRRGLLVFLFGLFVGGAGGAFLAVELMRGTLMHPGRVRIASPFAGILFGIIGMVWGIGMYRRAVRLGKERRDE